MEIKKDGNSIVLGKGISITLSPKDMYIISPADRTVYVVHNEGNSGIVTGYNSKGVAIGSYEYKNSMITRLFLRNGYANIVYRYAEPNEKFSWYQAKLLTNGYCTEIYFLHGADNGDSNIFYAENAQEANDATADTSKEAEVDKIISSVSLSKPKSGASEPVSNFGVAPTSEAPAAPAMSEEPLAEPITPVNPLLQPVPTVSEEAEDDDIEDITDDK